MCSNKGLESTEDWVTIYQESLDIQNFSIKNAAIIGNRAVFFARGRPRNVKEICCSFLLSFQLKIEDGVIGGLEGDYNYLKVDETMFFAPHTKP